MKLFTSTLIAAIVAILLPVVATAQPVNPVPAHAPGADGGVTINTADLRLVASPRQSVPITAAEPQLVEFQITGTPPVDTNSGVEPGGLRFDTSQLAGVLVRGYARFISDAPGDNAPLAGRQAQVIITGLNANQEFVRLDGFGASWRIEGDQGIVAGTPIVLRGNHAALVAAITELRRVKAADNESKDGDKEFEQTIAAGGDPISDSGGRSGGEVGKDDAKEEYDNPKRDDTTKTAELEQRPERACIDGAIRIDTELGVAFERRQIWLPSKSEYADCFDSSDPSGRYALKKNYASCDPRITGRKAVARFQMYYIKDSQPTAIGLCTDDQDLTFDITEDHANCQFSISETHVTPQADLGYINRSGARIQVRGCKPSTSRSPVRIATVTDSCNIRDEIGTGAGLGRSIVQGIDTYTIGGVTRRIGICKDTESVYAHEIDYAGCALQIDTGARLVTAQSRVIYRDNNGTVREIEGCRPDTTRTFAITEDTAGCPVAFDYEAGTATPQARLVYLNNQRRRTVLRDCAAARDQRPARLAVDTDACTPRTDFPGRLVHERATYTYALAGGSFTAATCRETGRTFALEKNFGACEAVVPSAAGGNVKGRFRWSYLNATSQTRFTSECEVDAGASATLVEDHDACETAIDYASGYATPQARLVYNDRNGQRVVSRDCAPSTSRRATRLVADIGACEQDIDIRAGRVAEMASYTYVLSGVTHRASDCRATGTSFNITRDDTSCATHVDIKTRRATARFRLVYDDGAGETRVAQDCTRDTARVVAVREDFTDCEVDVDYEAGTATPHSKLVYSGFNRREITARECAPATTRRRTRLEASTASCTANLDIPGGIVHERATYTYEIGDSTVTAATCRQTGRTFALARDYDGCPDQIPSRPGRSVVTKFRLSYLDANNRRQSAGDCQTDTGASATLVEDHDACETAIDYASGYATPQASLVYNDRNGQRVVSRDCAPSTSRRATRLIADIAACEQDIDIRTLRVAEMASYTYVLSGVTHRASDCRATGASFNITRDDTSCATHVDIKTRRATARFRLVYDDGAGETRVAQDCTRDTARVVKLREEHQNCTTKIDYTARTATPQAKLVYSGFDGRDVVARDCSASRTRRQVSLDLDRDACTLRNDIPRRRTHVRANFSYTLDGATRSVASCRDTGEYYALERGYAGCEVDVDITRGTAIQHGAWFYVDENGRNRKVGECEPDEDLVFDIIEDHDACKVFIDYAARKAVPRATLRYADRNGQRTEVRSCENSITIDPVDLVARADTCPIEHDFEAGTSYETGIFAFTLNGTTFQVGGCTRTGTSFRHTRVYHDSTNRYLCSPVIDRAGATVTKQHRLRIAVGGENRFVSQCRPDPSEASLPIETTTDGCTDPGAWTHDLAAGVSYSQRRYFYLNDNKRVYVSECQDGTTTYRHSHEIIRYAYNDARLNAQAVTRVTITPPTGAYVVDDGSVLPGATQIGYVRGEDVDERTGTVEYEVCSAYDTTLRYQQWRRPDNTQYRKPVGAGARVGPRGACTPGAGTGWTLTRSQVIARASCVQDVGRDGLATREVATQVRGHYRGTREIIREDGAIVRREAGHGSVDFHKSQFTRNCKKRIGATPAQTATPPNPTWTPLE